MEPLYYEQTKSMKFYYIGYKVLAQCYRGSSLFALL